MHSSHLLRLAGRLRLYSENIRAASLRSQLRSFRSRLRPVCDCRHRRCRSRLVYHLHGRTGGQGFAARNRFSGRIRRGRVLRLPRNPYPVLHQDRARLVSPCSNLGVDAGFRKDRPLTSSSPASTHRNRTRVFATLAYMRTRFVPCALLFAASTLLAQSFTPVRELKNLSPAAIEKLHTLEELNSLPAADWRFHAGDLAHGESPTLDDSAWPVVSAPAKAPKDAVWYRRTIEVPKTLHGYDITGSRVLFQFRAEANGPMPEIIYFNGRRVALGDDLEPIILFEPARPGDKILVAVKLLHTVDEKSFRGARAGCQPVPGHPEPGAWPGGNGGPAGLPGADVLESRTRARAEAGERP